MPIVFISSPSGDLAPPLSGSDHQLPVSAERPDDAISAFSSIDFV
jgi:hypothetical protein